MLLNVKVNFKKISGAVHEHSRSDRDLYISILSENVEPDAVRNFKKVTNQTHNDRNTPFDPLSIMMYGSTHFGTLDSAGMRKTTIKPLKPGLEIR